MSCTRSIRVIVILTLLVPGCGFMPKRVTAEETIEKTFETGSSPRITLELFNGNIELTAGKETGVDAVITKRGAGDTKAEAEADLVNVQVHTQHQGDNITIRAFQNDPLVGNRGASARLTVPAGAIVDVRTSNGQVAITGVTGGATANTSNGRIQFKKVKGPLFLNTSNGSLEIEAEQALIKEAHSSNGSIQFTGSLVDGSHSLRTSNGSVTLKLPADARFKVQADTSNGRVTCAFSLADKSGSNKELSGTVGESPQCDIGIHTSNGNVSIEKK